MVVGQRVRITGVPQDWMEPLVGLKGTVGEVRHNPKVDAYRVDGMSGDPWWFAASHLALVEDEAEHKLEADRRECIEQAKKEEAEV